MACCVGQRGEGVALARVHMLRAPDTAHIHTQWDRERILLLKNLGIHQPSRL